MNYAKDQQESPKQEDIFHDEIEIVQLTTSVKETLQFPEIEEIPDSSKNSEAGEVWKCLFFRRKASFSIACLQVDQYTWERCSCRRKYILHHAMHLSNRKFQLEIVICGQLQVNVFRCRLHLLQRYDVFYSFFEL